MSVLTLQVNTSGQYLQERSAEFQTLKPPGGTLSDITDKHQNTLTLVGVP